MDNYVEYLKSEDTPDIIIKNGSNWFKGECWNDEYEVYYNNIDFANEEHEKLFETVSAVDKKFGGSCKVLITYNNDPVIVELAKKYGFDMYVVKRLHNMVQSTKPGAMFEELIIANYDLQAQATANQNFIFEESRQLSLFDDDYYWK